MENEEQIFKLDISAKDIELSKNIEFEQTHFGVKNATDTLSYGLAALENKMAFEKKYFNIPTFTGKEREQALHDAELQREPEFLYYEPTIFERFLEWLF